jgi:hypothetical protein
MVLHKARLGQPELDFTPVTGVELHKAGTRFVVLGGDAVAFRGHPRATEDLDVLGEADGITFAEAVADAPRKHDERQ